VVSVDLIELAIAYVLLGSWKV